MSTQKLLKCEHCDHTTDREYNLQKHLLSKHDPNKVLPSCDICERDFKSAKFLEKHMKTHTNPYVKNNVILECANVKFDGANVKFDGANVKFDGANVKFDGANVKFDGANVKSFKCSKCDKVLQQKRYLIIHEEKCKGVNNSLECHLCHRLFNTRAMKCIHIKTCDGISQEKICIDDGNTIINNNIDTQNNINTQNVTNNTTNNNIYIENKIIMYADDNIELNDRHISKKDLKRIFNGASVQTITAIAKYAFKLLENPENRCIHKKHVTNSYCEVHVGNGKWKIKPDKQVLSRFSHDVAASANDRLYEHEEIGSQKVRDELATISSFIDGESSSMSNDVRKEIRSVILEVSKN
jgi:hypothetical protein